MPAITADAKKIANPIYGVSKDLGTVIVNTVAYTFFRNLMRR